MRVSHNGVPCGNLFCNTCKPNHTKPNRLFAECARYTYIHLEWSWWCKFMSCWFHMISQNEPNFYMCIPSTNVKWLFAGIAHHRARQFRLCSALSNCKNGLCWCCLAYLYMYKISRTHRWHSACVDRATKQAFVEWFRYFEHALPFSHTSNGMQNISVK